MTLSQQHLRRLWLRAAIEWRAFAKGLSPSPRLADAMRDFLGWQDIISAAAIRYRALRHHTLIPALSTKPQHAVAALLDKNLWAQYHVKKTQPVLEWVVKEAIAAEEDHLRQAAVTVEAGLRGVALPDARMLLYRQRRFLRDRTMEVVHTAEQVQLADPYIGSKFPFGEYRSREDRRVRPTHADMDGTVAALWWAGWAWCRPPCGYGCRCTVRWYSVFESKQKGWMAAAGIPRFEVKWGSPKAKANYLRGVPFHGNTEPHAFPSKLRDNIFPDAGPWMEAKFTAGQGLPAVAA